MLANGRKCIFSAALVSDFVSRMMLANRMVIVMRHDPCLVIKGC